MPAVALGVSCLVSVIQPCSLSEVECTRWDVRVPVSIFYHANMRLALYISIHYANHLPC